MAADAMAISQVLQDLAKAGKRSKRTDPDFAGDHYIHDPDRLCCSIAFDDSGEVLGFQSLKYAKDGNPYGTPTGWGIIGTHVRPASAGRGVGKALFAESLKAAKAKGLPAIEAYIGATNAQGIAYYEALGFVTYRPVEGVDCKRFLVS